MIGVDKDQINQERRNFPDETGKKMMDGDMTTLVISRASDGGYFVRGIEIIPANQKLTIHNDVLFAGHWISCIEYIKTIFNEEGTIYHGSE